MDLDFGIILQGKKNLSLDEKSIWYPDHTEVLPRGYKTFLMLSSVEHEILNAHIKYNNIKQYGCFLGSEKPIFPAHKY